MTTAAEITPPALIAPRISWGDVFGKIGPLVGLVFVLALFSALSYGSFATVGNGTCVSSSIMWPAVSVWRFVEKIGRGVTVMDASPSTPHLRIFPCITSPGTIA